MSSPSSFRLLLLLVCSCLIVACGGGGGSDDGGNASVSVGASQKGINDSNIRTAAMSGYMAYHQVNELLGNPLVLEINDFAHFNGEVQQLLFQAFDHWGDTSFEVSAEACSSEGSISVNFSDDLSTLRVTAVDCVESGGSVTDGEVTILKTPAAGDKPDSYSVGFAFTTLRKIPGRLDRNTSSHGKFDWSHLETTDESRYRFDVMELHSKVVAADGTTHVLDIKNFTSSLSTVYTSNSSFQRTYRFSGDIHIQDPEVPEPTNHDYFYVEYEPGSKAESSAGSSTEFASSAEMRIYGSGNTPLVFKAAPDGMRAGLYLDGRLKVELGLFEAIKLWAHSSP